MTDITPQSRSDGNGHAHTGVKACPTCEQPVPNERFEEIQKRFQQMERAQAEKMHAQLERERRQIETAARSAGFKAAEAANLEKLAEAERLKNEAVSRAENLQADMEAAVDQRVQAVEAAKAKEVSTIKAQHLKETLKWKEKAESLQRDLDQKSANDLGESAEMDLFEALKKAFPHDHISRVPRGTLGADIIQIVIHNGRRCGKIIHESKNSKQWRPEYISKAAQRHDRG